MEVVNQSSQTVDDDIQEDFNFEPEYYDSDDDSLLAFIAPSAYDRDNEDEKGGSQTEVDRVTRTKNKQGVVT